MSTVGNSTSYAYKLVSSSIPLSLQIFLDKFGLRFIFAFFKRRIGKNVIGLSKLIDGHISINVRSHFNNNYQLPDFSFVLFFRPTFFFTFRAFVTRLTSVFSSLSLEDESVKPTTIDQKLSIVSQLEQSNNSPIYKTSNYLVSL